MALAIPVNKRQMCVDESDSSTFILKTTVDTDFSYLFCTGRTLTKSNTFALMVDYKETPRKEFAKSDPPSNSAAFGAHREPRAKSSTRATSQR